MAEVQKSSRRERGRVENCRLPAQEPVALRHECHDRCRSASVRARISTSRASASGSSLSRLLTVWCR
jgi:hypothetical protein